ncbi:MAG TPA: aminoglycoside phosphotransferase family protein [Candidatus Obscuribacter sp.]|nr:aminoglycoside phosphotransferase family protein [Candidatus Obscuribacter sp.]HNG75615.1 aminoglycoside phosphotransferase family protein [Candidatus Obscuribacter sp.]
MEHIIRNQGGNQFISDSESESCRAIWAGFAPVLSEPVFFAAINADRFLASSAAGRVIVSKEPSWRTEETITREAALLHELSGTERLPYHLPLLLPCKDHAEIPYLKNGGRLWTARKFIAGKSFDWRRTTWEETHCRAAAAALAQLHRLSSDEDRRTTALNQGGKPVDYEKACLLDLEGLLKEFQAQVGARQGSSAEQGAEAARRCLEKIRQALPFTDEVEGAVWIHGDFHPGNVIFTSTNAAVGVIDWDFARRGDRLFDFMYSRLMFAGSFREEACQELFKPELDRAFTSAYLNLIDFPCQEQALAQRATLALSLILCFELTTFLPSSSQGTSIRTLIEQIGRLQPAQVKLPA